MAGGLCRRQTDRPYRQKKTAPGTAESGGPERPYLRFYPRQRPGPAPIFLYFLVFTFFNGAARPVNTALLTDITRPEERSAAFSLLYLGINIGVAAGPILAGFLFNNYRRWIFWGDGLTTHHHPCTESCYGSENRKFRAQNSATKRAMWRGTA